MPYLEITIPKIDPQMKKCVASMLTEAFAATTPFGADIFGIRFFEYLPGEVAIGGKLLNQTNDKPYIHFLLYCPRLKRAAKQKLVAALAEGFTKATNNETWKPVIHICEHPYYNVGIEGRLLSDAYEECAKRAFYYELPKD
jgi:phenylpyruvate tautomerase PptA (4-oxalocrotonate tautomerase family)